MFVPFVNRVIYAAIQALVTTMVAWLIHRYTKREEESAIANS